MQRKIRCPKCKYVFTDNDTKNVWQCPQCGKMMENTLPPSQRGLRHHDEGFDMGIPMAPMVGLAVDAFSSNDAPDTSSCDSGGGDFGGGGGGDFGGGGASGDF